MYSDKAQQTSWTCSAKGEALSEITPHYKTLLVPFPILLAMAGTAPSSQSEGCVCQKSAFTSRWKLPE